MTEIERYIYTYMSLHSLPYKNGKVKEKTFKI